MMLEVIDRDGKALGDGRDIAADQTFDVSQARGHTTQRRDRRIVLIAGDRNDVRVETAHVRTVLKLGEYDVYQSCSLRPIFRRDIDAHPVSLCEIPDLAHALFVVARQARKVVGQGFQIGDALRRRKGVYSLEPLGRTRRLCKRGTVCMGSGCSNDVVCSSRENGIDERRRLMLLDHIENGETRHGMLLRRQRVRSLDHGFSAYCGKDCGFLGRGSFVEGARVQSEDALAIGKHGDSMVDTVGWRSEF